MRFLKIFSPVIFFLLLPIFSSFVNASEVYVRGEKGNWCLDVDGRPFYIQGVSCGMARGKSGEDYLELASALGANAVRTWGIDQGTQEYFDRAASLGLKVMAGIWLNYADEAAGISYVRNEDYKRLKKEEILSYVSKFKDHPALLMWGLGNEALFFTKDEKEKVALSSFMEELIGEIRRLDLHHPIVYASASTSDLKYLLKYVPSLDVIGINEYGSIRMAHGTWDFLGFNKPYLLTEYGPFINLDRPRDINNKSIELSDHDKAKLYRSAAEQIQSFMGYNIGGFAFHLGETTQESITWWNLNHGNFKKRSFWAIYELYTGKKASQLPVRITNFSLGRVKNVKPGDWITTSLGLENYDLENLDFEYVISSCRENVLQYYVNEYEPLETDGVEPCVRIRAPQRPGVYRVYCFVKDKLGNIATANKTISVK